MAQETVGDRAMEARASGSHAQMVCTREIAASVRRARRGSVADKELDEIPGRG